MHNSYHNQWQKYFSEDQLFVSEIVEHVGEPEKKKLAFYLVMEEGVRFMGNTPDKKLWPYITFHRNPVPDDAIGSDDGTLEAARSSPSVQITFPRTSKTNPWYAKVADANQSKLEIYFSLLELAVLRLNNVDSYVDSASLARAICASLESVAGTKLGM